jgi:hypothetical protein
MYTVSDETHPSAQRINPFMSNGQPLFHNRMCQNVPDTVSPLLTGRKLATLILQVCSGPVSHIRSMVKRRRPTSGSVQTFLSGEHIRADCMGLVSSSAKRSMLVSRRRSQAMYRHSCPADTDGCSVHVMSSAVYTLGRFHNLDAVTATIFTSAWCDGTPRGLGCVTWLAGPGTFPTRTTANGGEKSSRLVG